MKLKEMALKMGGAAANAAYKVTAINVNTACCFVSHQPKLPEAAMKLKKEN